MAIKKIDNAALSLQEEDNFLEAVSNMARLRHPNIVTLAGYCAEHGQRLLVYEYIGNGNLHDMLHFAEDSSKALSWNARVRIALGTARALEYVGFIITYKVYFIISNAVIYDIISHFFIGQVLA